MEHCDCNLGKAFCDASVEELTAFYKKMTGRDPKPGQIEALKGECKLGPGIEVGKYAQLVKIGLQESVKEEREAQETYFNRRITAIDSGDDKTAAIYNEIILDERDHEQKFQKRLEEI